MFSRSLGHEISADMIGKNRTGTLGIRPIPSWFHLLGFYIASACSLFAAPDWQASLTKDPPGNFPPLRPLHGKYVFGWSGFTAATAEVHFFRPGSDRCQVEGSGRTVGLARALWQIGRAHV